ncbi:hypothetical protein CSUI_002967 [Cystoisospora suis]|uniref:Uncharacterized protein n=1 Tax=Cystoisospora suis TaxID=483139 RepID=A0A2C6L4F3_9APIC|nr:hypothetical protein CSUI_002967 [Cystoisospora suis]
MQQYDSALTAPTMATKVVMSAHGVGPASCGISSSRLLKSPCANPEAKLKSEKSGAECHSFPASASQPKSSLETAVTIDDFLSPRVFPPRALHFSGNCADSNDWESTDDEEQSPAQTYAKAKEGRGKYLHSPHRKDGMRVPRLECTSSASNNSWKAGSVLSPSRRGPLGRKARRRSSRMGAASTWRGQKSATALLPTEPARGSLCKLSNLDFQRNRHREDPAGERDQSGSIDVELTKESGKRRRERIRRRPRPSPSCPVKSKSAAADGGRCWHEEEDEDFFTDSWGDGLHSNDLFDRLGIFASDDNLQRRDPDRDSFLLDFEEGLFDSDDGSPSLLGDPYEDYMCSEGVSDDHLPLLLRNRPRIRDGPTSCDSEAGGVGSSPSLAAEERDEEEAATYTLVKQMVNTLGVRNWADFLQLQAEYWLFSHAHKQALITATAAERMIPDQSDHASAGASPGLDPESQHTDTEAAASASPPQESAPSHTIEQPLANRGRVQVLAVKMVAACALHQFMRSAQILRKLQPRDFDCLSPPLQAYADAAVRFLAGSAAHPR